MSTLFSRLFLLLQYKKVTTLIIVGYLILIGLQFYQNVQIKSYLNKNLETMVGLVDHHLDTGIKRTDHRVDFGVEDSEKFKQNAKVENDRMYRLFSYSNLLFYLASVFILLITTHYVINTIDFLLRIKQESLDRERLVSENVPGFAMFSLNRKGLIKTWNPGSQKLLGFVEEEIIGQNVANLVVDANMRDQVQRFFSCPNANGIFHFEAWKRCKDGHPFFADVIVAPIFSDNDEVIGYLNIIRDLTERKNMESEWLEAKNRAEAASRVQSAFLAHMSHELRTPINGVLGMVGSLVDSPLNEKQKEYLGYIHTSADNLLTIVNDILDFNKIEAGKVSLEKFPFDLKELLISTLRSVEFSVGRKPVKLELVGAEEWPNLFIGDPGRCRQVLLNLLSNAVKFTEKGTVKLVVTRDYLREEKTGFTFSVVDEGIGIKPDFLGQIFHPFSQEDTSTSRRFGGTGLGLPISHKLVALMGGDLQAKSLLGKGSTFWFNLEFGIGPLVTLKNEKSEDRTGTLKGETATQRQKYRVLIVEDNFINQKVTLMQLEKLGYRADTVSSGVEALKNLGIIHYDLVLMDCQMPEMDGYEATQHIRSSETAYKKIPIVALTAHAMKSERQKCLDCGMDDHIAKPTTTENLARVLDQYLNVGEGSKKNMVPSGTNLVNPGESVLSAEVIGNIRSLSESNPSQLLAELKELFMTTFPREFKTLKAAYDAADFKTVQRLAHKLKSSGGNLGALRFADFCNDLEHRENMTHSDDVAYLINEIGTEYEKILSAMDVEIHKAA